MKLGYFDVLAREAIGRGDGTAPVRADRPAGPGAMPAEPLRPTVPSRRADARPGGAPPPPAAAAPQRAPAEAGRRGAVRTPPKMDLGRYLDRRRVRP